MFKFRKIFKSKKVWITKCLDWTNSRIYKNWNLKNCKFKKWKLENCSD
jgi:hypothetical protein